MVRSNRATRANPLMFHRCHGFHPSLGAPFSGPNYFERVTDISTFMARRAAKATEKCRHETSVSWCLAMGVFNVLQICSWFQAFPYNVSADIIHTMIQALLKSIFLKWLSYSKSKGGAFVPGSHGFRGKTKDKLQAHLQCREFGTQLIWSYASWSFQWIGPLKLAVCWFTSHPLTPKVVDSGRLQTLKLSDRAYSASSLICSPGSFCQERTHVFAKKKRRAPDIERSAGMLGNNSWNRRPTCRAGKRVWSHTRWDQTWMG